MFEGFDQHRIEVEGLGLSVRTAGSGPPLLLLHGFPETSAAWHLVAPTLTGDFTVVAPDLPGYGASDAPAPNDIDAHSKRRMAGCMMALMQSLGHEDFFLAGHDRGGRVAYRLALDHPQRVRKLALLDVATTLDTWEGMDWEQALETYHWPLLAQPYPVPERLIGADPIFYLHHLLDRWAGSPDCLAAAAVADYETAFAKPSVLRAMCNDYRAGATIDRDHDAADRAAGRKIACPLLVLRGSRYIASPLADAWRLWAGEVREEAFDCGHFLAEENPDACSAALRRFFDGK